MTRHRSVYLLLSTLLPLLTAPLVAETARPIVSEHAFGCKSEQYLSDLVRFAAEKDFERFKKGLVTGITLEECTLFKKGEEVLVLDTKIFEEPKNLAGLARVRREGEAEEYWTDIASVKRQKPEAAEDQAAPERSPRPSEPSEPPPEDLGR